jgi:DNA-binding NarL/FixJ family response regulator
MSDTRKKIFTYVSPQTHVNTANKLCYELPIILNQIPSIQELFPLISNPLYYTDFIAISVDTFYKTEYQIDTFDIIQALSTLIKSNQRNTKIIVLVDESTNASLIRNIISFPCITSVAMILKRPEQFKQAAEYINRLSNDDYSLDPQVLELIKPKKKLRIETNNLKLTARQEQVLRLIQERGCSNKVLGRILKLSESTIKMHVGAILKKYGLKNRTQIAISGIKEK